MTQGLRMPQYQWVACKAFGQTRPHCVTRDLNYALHSDVAFRTRRGAIHNRVTVRARN